METNAFSEIFPLFDFASADTLEWLLSVVEEQDYPKDTVLITEDNWGKAVFFVVSGWIKIRYSSREQQVTLDILSRGDCFGEMAVLDEAPRLTEVVALSDVELVSISAQRFIQMLYKEPQLHHRMLQLTVKRVRQSYRRFLLSQYSAKVRLVKTLIALAENYGQSTERGTEILYIPDSDLADLAGINEEETGKILESIHHKGWIEIDKSHQTLALSNLKQLNHLVKQL
ncbi:Crp/Fnr family transcriptional regulator [Gloeothece verrucosa]|uniref:Transcriptional regulator, Crp/Fnr family n=1 Tax=Gloeothece verrucosa (strain PCC 7822) TaxID=497965 RepID=E0UGJ0_GLOV7|nr:Crp/Fnr family transcriptional regulator [Gloeothece verrucosa]ADN13199.1 transcriptional regulator, Crp/Fnr family [Gloeothece verrucosa PCC 7822]